MKKEYSITKEQCQEMIDTRMPIVCAHCGGNLEPIETVDNAGEPTHWAGCNECNRYNWGVSPLVYKISSSLVENGHRAYKNRLKPSKDDIENYKYWERGQVSGTVGLVMDVLRLEKELSI